MNKFSPLQIYPMEESFTPIIIDSNPLKYEPLVVGMKSPIAIADLGASMLLADQFGPVYEFSKLSKEVKKNPVMDLSSVITPLNNRYDERGLLNIIFNSHTGTSLYVYYTVPTKTPGYDHACRLSEYLVGEAAFIPGQNVVTWNHPEMNHNGGGMTFGHSGLLYLGTGDGGGAGDRHGRYGNAQNLSSPWGKIWQYDPRGKQMNLYSWGWRNPWRLSLWEDTGDSLVVGEVGQDKVEGVALVLKPGENHGWRALENGHPFDIEQLEMLEKENTKFFDPFITYNRDVGISVIGGYSQPDGSYLFGDWKGPDDFDNVFLWKNGAIHIHPHPSIHRERDLQSFGIDNNANIYGLFRSEEGEGAIYSIKSF